MYTTPRVSASTQHKANVKTNFYVCKLKRIFNKINTILYRKHVESHEHR